MAVSDSTSIVSRVRRRVALFVLFCATGIGACNALTGIGDYAVGTETVDAADDVTTSDANSSTPPDAGADADADADDGADGCMIVDNPAIKATSCTEDAGYMGPAMASLLYGGPLEFHCIDTTEVTVAQYKVFLGARGATNTCGQPPGCDFNKTYAAAASDPDDTNKPQVSVNWCDAFMYCQWAGKHLCGTMGYTGGSGGDMPSANVPTAPSTLDEQQGVDEWYTFCLGTGDGAGSAYFYGDTPVAGTCQDATISNGRIAPVETVRACHGTGASTGVYDMLGNAAEWEWSCSDELGGMSSCLARGGSFADGSIEELGCTSTATYDRRATAGNLGFRCCVE